MNRHPSSAAIQAPRTGAPRCTGLAGMFEAQVRRRPDATAVTCGDARLSYAQLDRRANRVANHLLGLGVGRDTLVGLCLERSIDLIAGMLGIVKAGAAYLPLDLVYPKDRLALMLDDAEARFVLTLSGDRDALPVTTARVICLDTEVECLAGADDSAPGIDHGPDALAYVIYTSGSTGRPKGCQVTQRNVARLFSATQAWFGFNERDVWTFFHSHAFDFSVWEIWGALLHGGRVVIVPNAVSRSPEAFRRLLIQERVTILNQTPSAFLQLMRADEAAAERGDYALREVIFGGEALQLQSLRPWIDRYGDARPRLVNMYGITETTVHVTYRPIVRADLDSGIGSVLGVPLPDLTLHVLDGQLQPVPAGSEGELFVGGAGVARGYLKRPELNAQRFIQWRAPDREGQAERLYRSGDLVRVTLDGDLEYLGRIDTQVKIRGFRIETGEIEAALTKHPQVCACAVIAREDSPGDRRLVAYVVSGDPPSAPVLRTHLAATLPEYMLPAAFVVVDALPLTENGKLDRHALPAPGRERPELACAYEPPVTHTERRICAAFAAVLDIDRIGRHDSFFELGGNSMLATRLLEQVRSTLAGFHPSAADVPVTALFRDPTPAALAAVIARGGAVPVARARLARTWRGDDADSMMEPIAIVAMAGRFPGAADVESFWQNLCEGRDSITLFRPEELDPAVSAADRASPSYVSARGVIEGVEQFDAAFFGICPREAELMDPQQRIFLELCWECMERAGHVPGATAGPVGVFAGMFNASYFQRHVSTRPDLIEDVGAFQVMLANEKDFIATRVAHKLNLTGPAISVHTACSTSLVAICQAADSLRAGHCDMALAGGVSISCPPRSGYFHQDGAMLSPDGHTRTFDARAQGTVFSDGATVVLLKRLSDAIADGNQVFAVIRGGAINNDGGDKASFTAPSSEGQAAVIAMAHERARVDPRSIGYVETHGTATPVGDPIEIEGLTRAFRRGTADTGFCRIGSVKSNIGHLVVAAGGAGLIKTALALAERRIPGTLHFQSPNPAIDFAGSPFVVNASLSEWTSDGFPRRAGVSSFGVGGTNAHVVLEEAPVLPQSEPAVGSHLFVLSARTPAALGQACACLADHLQAQSDANLADVAWTLAVGRKAFAHRAALVVDDVDQAIAALRSETTAAASGAPARQSEVVFLFPGQGATYPGMGRALYETEPAFREAVDECAQVLFDELGYDLRERLFDEDPEALLPTSVMQPATFVVEYALARWWMTHGIVPSAMIGHSVGEFVAATLAGVFALPDALRLVARRGALMQAQPAGAMLSVRLGADAILARLPPGVSLAAENAPGACVVAGPQHAVAKLQAQLEGEGIACRALHTSHAFHSEMMEPVVAPFLVQVSALRLSAPTLPMVSTATGDWLDAAAATSPLYWARHLREPVRFTSALGRVLDAPARVLLEVGPRATLGALARQHPGQRIHGSTAVASLADSPGSEAACLRRAVGQLWARGVQVDPAVFDRRAIRRRLRLPTYPFQRQRYWIEAAAAYGSNVVPIAPAMAAHDRAVTMVDRVAVLPHLVGPADAQAVNPATHTAAPARRDRLIAQLKAAFGQFIGADISDTDAATNFMELGIDSLALTQVALYLQKTFATRITFRQLMGECATLERLAAHLDSQLPPEDLPEPEPEPQATATVMPALPLLPAEALPAGDGMDSDYLRQLIERQMQLMESHIALLASGASARAVPADAVKRTPPLQSPSLRSDAAVTRLVAPTATGELAPPPPGNRSRAPMDAAFPPVAGAKLGREPDGRPGWFKPQTAPPGKFLKVGRMSPSGSALDARLEPVDHDPFAAGELSHVVPTTEAQREIWLADQIDEDASRSFNLSVSFWLRGPLDASCLRAALQQLVDRNDALRACVGPDGETFCVLQRFAVELPMQDLRGLDADARKASIDARVRCSTDTRFVLHVGPLFRAELLQVADDEHLFLLSAHHIVCDGWSWWLLTREIGALYGRACGIGSAPLPEPASFVQYAMAEAARASGAAHADDEAYWLSRLSGDVPVLDLPSDHPRPLERSFASAREDHVLDARLLGGLRSMGARRGASVFATLLAGFSALLARLSEQSRVVVAIPAAGQPVDGHDNLIGHCVNLLPLDFDTDPSRPFTEAIDAAQARLIDSLEHQRYTFGTLLKKLRVRRDPGRMPLVSVLFNLDQALGQESSAFPGLELEFKVNPRTFETFELFVNAVQVRGELHLQCQYNRDLYDAATVQHWLRAFETLLRNAVERENAELGSLPLVDAVAQLELASLQPAPVDFDRECRMHEHFEAQCDRAPHRTALRCGGVACSYAELEERANRMAHLLRGHGVRRGSLVGLALDRGIDMVAALLGVLKAGAGYVPLDPQFPADRLAYMAADAGLAVLLTSAAHAPQFDLHGRSVQSLDRMGGELAAASSSRIGRDAGAAEPEGIAYVIYTSGSTGRPKGVQVPHRAVANFLAGMQREPGLCADDRLLAVTTLSFDIAVLEIMLPLCVGAEIVLADRETAGDGMALAGLLARSGATAMQGTPSTWRMLLDAGWEGVPGFKVLCGGEALTHDLAGQLLPRCGALWNLYGPTETTVWSTCARIVAAAAGQSPDIGIGRPIANTRVWILDSRGELCPKGVPGEICIGGEGLSLGYLGRPELTAERFIVDRWPPHNDVASRLPVPLLYRTGDRGRWRPDGSLEHLGRLDHQVKVRGYRIEPGEIEANLAAREEIARALVIVREDRPDDQRLVAYLVARPGARIDEAALSAHLGDVLPAYMVPRHFVVLDAIPLLPNGKLDRMALPSPLAPQAGKGSPKGPSRATAEQDPRVRFLAAIWSELLGCPAGADDNFFELGGHSMLAVQMVTRVQRETGVRIKLIRLGTQTLGEIAADLPVPRGEGTRRRSSWAEALARACAAWSDYASLGRRRDALQGEAESGDIREARQ